jgi:hypothetical protein
MVATVACTALVGGTAALAVTKRAAHLHDARYCEIIELKGSLPNAHAIVLNTIGQGTCPAAWWRSLDSASLATELGAAGVVLNGPRHFLMDSASAATGEVVRIHGQRLTTVASLPIKTAADLIQTPYTERTVSRTNTWQWNKGRTVFELSAPGAKKYVMQSYAQIKDPSLTLAKLRGLGHRLALPSGWHYRARTLKHELILRAHKSATITQDELQNTYQLVGG